MTSVDPLAHASFILDAVLLGDLDLEVEIQVVLALSMLDDVDPPPAPRAQPTHAIPADEGIEQVLRELRAVIHGVGPAQPDADTALRAGLACSYLLDLLPEDATTTGGHP